MANGSSLSHDIRVYAKKHTAEQHAMMIVLRNMSLHSTDVAVWPHGVRDADIIAVRPAVQLSQMLPQRTCDGHRGQHYPFMYTTRGTHILRLVPDRVQFFGGTGPKT